MATTKGKKIGPRVTVEFAKAKRKTKANPRPTGASYIFMRKETADYFGFKIVPSAAVKTKKGYTVAVRGSFGAGSIKVPMGKPGTAKGGKSVTRYRQIPVPGGSTIADIQKFLKTATRNKPSSFSSVDGRTYPVITK